MAHELVLESQYAVVDKDVTQVLVAPDDYVFVTGTAIVEGASLDVTGTVLTLPVGLFLLRLHVNTLDCLAGSVDVVNTSNVPVGLLARPGIVPTSSAASSRNVDYFQVVRGPAQVKVRQTAGDITFRENTNLFVRTLRLGA